MSAIFVCKNCGRVVEETDPEEVLRHINRLAVSGHLTLRVTNRMKPEGDEPSKNVPLFDLFNRGQCQFCGEPFTFVRAGDSTHVMIEEPVVDLYRDPKRQVYISSHIILHET